jgi:hypothetical protein
MWEWAEEGRLCPQKGRGGLFHARRFFYKQCALTVSGSAPSAFAEVSADKKEQREPLAQNYDEISLSYY